MDRNKELMQLLDAEAREYAIWDESADTAPHGGYWDAVDELLVQFAANSGRGVMAASVPLVDKLREAYTEFNSAGFAVQGAKYWRLRGEVQDSGRRTPPILQALATVQQLTDQKVNAYQICRIWRLIDEKGHERTDWVQDELSNPGSVITPEYVEHVNRLRQIEAGWPADDFEVTKKKANRVPAAVVHPTDIETLIRQRVSAQQIHSLKRKQYGDAFPISLITGLADAMQISIPGSADAVLNKAQADYVRDVTHAEPQLPQSLPPVIEREIGEGDDDALRDAVDEDASIEQQVAEMYDGGHDHKTIATHLGISNQKVKAIIKSYAMQESEIGE